MTIKLVLMSRFRILQIFSRYFQQGGEEVFSQKFKMAAPPEWEISDFEGSSAALVGPRLVSKLTLPLRAFHDFSVSRALCKIHAAENFDAWIVQNALPGLTPAVYQTAFDLGVPLIQYLHNYRMGCTNGFFLNHGRACERCLAGNFWPAFLTGCWRNSRWISGGMGLILRRVRSLGTFHKVAAWVALNQHQKQKHVEMGIPSNRIHVVPHFFLPKEAPPPSCPSGYVLFIGRLSSEKGLDILLHAWKQVRSKGRLLAIAGSGPEAESLKNLADRLGLSSVRFLGFVSAEDHSALWAGAAFSVIPSIWHEPFPLSFLESWSFARPVVASRLGAMAENIESGRDGILVQPFSAAALAEGLQQMIDWPERIPIMGYAGEVKLKQNFSQEVWRKRIQLVLEAAFVEGRQNKH